MRFIENFAIGACVVIVLTAGYVITMGIAGIAQPKPFDDCDDAAAGTRCGMRVHTDTLTGCQYLSTRYGGPTPRVDVHGNHICKPKVSP